MTGTPLSFSSAFVPIVNQNIGDFFDGLRRERGQSLICHETLQQLHHILSNAIFQLAGLDIQHFQFLVQLFQFLGKDKAVGFAFGHAHIAARIQAPALRLNLLQRRHFAQAQYIGIFAFGEVLLHHGFAAVGRFDFLAAIQPHDVGDELDLFWREFAVRAIDLAVEMAGVDEEDGVLRRIPSPSWARGSG